jgi:hypothetical protein
VNDIIELKGESQKPRLNIGSKKFFTPFALAYIFLIFPPFFNHSSTKWDGTKLYDTKGGKASFPNKKKPVPIFQTA